jgi:hypothetical protein
MPAGGRQNRGEVEKVLVAGDLPQSDASFAQGLATADLSMEIAFVPSPAKGEGWGESPVWKVSPKPGGGSPLVNVPKFELPEEEEEEQPQAARSADDSMANSWEIMPPTPARGAAAEPADEAEPAEESDPEAEESDPEVEEDDELEPGVSVLQLTVPDEMNEDRTIEVELPDGNVIELEVPEGLEPGDEFEAEVNLDMDLDGDGVVTQDEMAAYAASKAAPEPSPAPSPSPSPAPRAKRSSSKSRGGGCCAARTPKDDSPRKPAQPTISAASQLSPPNSDEDEDEEEEQEGTVLQLTVPEGLESNLMEVELPDGNIIQLEIPEGLEPGDEFEAEVDLDMDLDGDGVITSDEMNARMFPGTKSEEPDTEDVLDDTNITLEPEDDEAVGVGIAATDLWEAVHDFAPARKTDLALTSGDLVVVTNQDPAKSWWKGFLYEDPEKQEGEFPFNYVEPLEEDEVYDLLGLDYADGDEQQELLDDGGGGGDDEQSVRLVGWSDGKKVEAVRLRRGASGFGMTINKQCVVTKLQSGGSAATAGVQLGDSVRCIDSKPVNTHGEATALLSAVAEPGATVELDLVRGEAEPEPEPRTIAESVPPARVRSQQQADELAVAASPQPVPAPKSPRAQVMQLQAEEERELEVRTSSASKRQPTTTAAAADSPPAKAAGGNLQDFYAQLKTTKSPPVRPAPKAAGGAHAPPQRGTFRKADFNLSETSEEEDAHMSTEGDHHASIEELERLAERTAAMQKEREAERQRLLARVSEMEASAREKDAMVSKLERKAKQLEQGLSERERHVGESTSKTQSLEAALVAAEASTVEQEQKVVQVSAQLKKQSEENKALQARLEKMEAQTQAKVTSMAVDTEAIEAEAAELRDANRALEVRCQTLNTRVRETEEGRQREQEKIKAERMSLEVAEERCGCPCPFLPFSLSPFSLSPSSGSFFAFPPCFPFCSHASIALYE